MKFDAAVHMVQRLGQGALLAKADIKSAFRLLPVAKAGFKIIGFKFKGKWFFDKAMPFGCSAHVPPLNDLQTSCSGWCNRIVQPVRSNIILMIFCSGEKRERNSVI